jgi:lipoprotein-anchoring transpeptidase ErfK/SrfK
VPVAFSEPVASVAYGGKTVNGTRTSVSIPAPAPAGSVRVAVAARSWERLGPPATVHYFPRAKRPVALIAPAPGGRLDPGDQLRITLSQPVATVLGARTPKLSPNVPGHWRRTNDHTLVFTPSGSGAPLGSRVQLTLPHTVAAADATGHGAKTTRTIAWTVPPASPLRLVQLLAGAGYLPVDFKASSEVARTARAQASAAADPPKGHFAWRYSHTPHELKSQWAPSTGSVVVRGAIMMFEDEHHMTADGLAGPALWKALLQDTLAGKRRTAGYSYVYVHRNVPQLLTLWHNGRVVTTSPGNTGIPAAPTDLGTFPVFEHLAVTTMSGTNPDGSTYNDPGIKWVSYFNGGDALHTFNRASFGTPQSLGCVELPESAARKIWPYTPIGTLVTIEN